jgi:hypothetical protein
MYRLAWFIAGCVAAYIASGYVEGLTEETDADKEEKGRKKAAGGAA